jgi:hypothetical protein
MNRAMLLKRILFRKRGAVVLGVALFGLAFLWGWGNQQMDPSAIHERVKKIAESEGIVIGLGAPETFFVPPYTAADARAILGDGNSAIPVEIDAVPPALDGIEKALRVYPPGFFGKNCKAIFLAGSLTLDGARAGGTWNKDWIILSARKENSKEGIYETAWYGVHHEFSSLVWNRFPELRAIWNSLLPLGWVPARRNAVVLEAPDSLITDPRDGFLSAYGATNLQNDFNIYAETVFIEPSYVAEHAGRYPVVAKKLALLMEAYIQLDRRFEDVFERVGLLRFRSALPASFGEGVSVSPSYIPQGRIVPSGSSGS